LNSESNQPDKDWNNDQSSSLFPSLTTFTPKIMPATDKSPNASPSTSHKANSAETAKNDQSKVIHTSANNDSKHYLFANKTNDKATSLNNKNEIYTQSISNSKNAHVLTAPTHPPPPVPFQSNLPESDAKETKGISKSISSKTKELLSLFKSI